MNLLSLLFVALSFILNTYCLEVSDINVAVVEYHPNFTKSQNEKSYEKIINSIKQPTDFIIFPESSLTRGEYLVVPPIHASPNCSTNKSDTLTHIACLAKSKNAYVAINIDERVDCKPNDSTCGPRGFLGYNTDVVFGRNGSVIARYRKWNLFGEFDKNITKTPDIITIETDKGKFGIFTCFDILFQTPALNLTRSGVKNFIYPSMWFSELPFLTALQAQQMWSYENDALLLSSGGNNIVVGSGGSGVFLGKYGALNQTIVPNIKKEEYLIITTKVPSNRTALKIKEDTVHETDEIARKIDHFFIKRDDLRGYTSELLNMTTGSVSREICHGNNPKLCCKFNVTLKFNKTRNDMDSYLYRFVAYSGVKTFVYNDGGVEVCGIIPCTNSSLDSCTRKFSSYDNITWPTTFESISITANFTNDETAKMQYPNTLLSSLRSIPPSQTRWEKRILGNQVERSFRLVKPQTRLLTFAIYGRDCSRDNFFSNPGVSINENKVYFLLVACSVFALLCRF
ncbi:unnamed protein product [Brassicogethes aeneus]|uniref:CN hydrolase domain-containing protein n=1 Tax=Brassicogethes aeneus TaxID=1431903 RepID=A0A9P0AW04_BRAAE|nr:unnamed protein product [Brassicogethes aeneus]